MGRVLFLYCIEAISANWLWLGPLLLACFGVITVTTFLRAFEGAFDEIYDEVYGRHFKHLGEWRNGKPMSKLPSAGQG